MACPFPKDLIADPVRGACVDGDGRRIAAAVYGEDAVLVGGYDKNPCTDLALGFGDLAPGERRTCSVTVRLSEEPVDDMIHRLRRA